MKKLLISVLVSAAFIANGQNNEPFETHTFSPVVTASIKSVEATTQNGTITVRGNATSGAVVEMFVRLNVSNSWLRTRIRGESEEIKQILEEEYIVDVGVENGKLYAIARPKDQRAQQKLSISFRITVPERVNSDLRTSNASIRISNLSGSQNFRTSNGSVTVENVLGKIVGTTSNGSITVLNSSDEIDLRTSNGSITARNLKGVVTLRTSNGSVNISNLNGVISTTTSNGSVTATNLNGELRTTTSNGSVRLIDVRGSVNARTTNGGITATILSAKDFVTLSTTNGNINLTVPSGKGYDVKARAQRISTSGLANFSGKIDGKNLDGRVGTGGTKIDLTTSGRLQLSFD